MMNAKKMRKSAAVLALATGMAVFGGGFVVSGMVNSAIPVHAASDAAQNAGTALNAETPTQRNLNVVRSEWDIGDPSDTAVDMNTAAAVGAEAVTRFFGFDVNDAVIAMSYFPAAAARGPRVWVGGDNGGVHEEYTAIFVQAFEESGLTVSEFLNSNLSRFPFTDGSRPYGGDSGFDGSVGQWSGRISNGSGGYFWFRVHGQTGALIQVDDGSRRITESRAGLEGEATQAQIEEAIRYAMDAVSALDILQPVSASVDFISNAIEQAVNTPRAPGEVAVDHLLPEDREIHASVGVVTVKSAEGDYVRVFISGIMEDELHITGFELLSDFEEEIAAIPATPDNTGPFLGLWSTPIDA